MAALHDGPDRHGERLAAILAIVDAGPRALARQLRDPIAHHAAARADWALRPQNALQVSAGRVVIVADRVARIDFFASHCGRSSIPQRSYTLWFATSTR